MLEIVGDSLDEMTFYFAARKSLSTPALRITVKTTSPSGPTYRLSVRMMAIISTLSILLLILITTILCCCRSPAERGRQRNNEDQVRGDEKFGRIIRAVAIEGVYDPRNNKYDQKLCTICLDTLAEGTPIRTLTGCAHVFHRDCIESWVRARLNRGTRCPLCNAQLDVGAEGIRVEQRVSRALSA